MIDAAVELFAENGFLATSLVGVVESSGTPRGSVYHHFPGGKEELALEAAVRAKTSMADLVHALAKEADGGPGALVAAFFGFHIDVFQRSGFRRGCPVATVALEMSDNAELREAIGAVFDKWRAAFETEFISAGLPNARAEAWASLVISAFEGALIQARVSQSVEPLKVASHEFRTLIDRERGLAAEGCRAGPHAQRGRPSGRRSG